MLITTSEYLELVVIIFVLDTGKITTPRGFRSTGV